MSDDESEQGSDKEGRDGEKKPYLVGRGRPPLASRWKKGGPSPNRQGRPRQSKRLQLPWQYIQDVLRALDAPVSIRGKLIPFSVANLELIKSKAAAGHAPSQRYLNNLRKDTLQEVAVRHPELTSKALLYCKRLQQGDPPAWVITVLNEIAEELDQQVLDPTVDVARRKRGRQSQRERLAAKSLERQTKRHGEQSVRRDTEEALLNADPTKADSVSDGSLTEEDMIHQRASSTDGATKE